MRFKSLLDNTVQDVKKLNDLIRIYKSDYEILTSKGPDYWVKLSNVYPSLYKNCCTIADFIAIYEDAKKPLTARAEKDIAALAKKLILTNMQAKNANKNVIKALK